MSEAELYERRIASELLYEGRILSLERAQVELSNGSRSSRELVHHRGGVAVLALDDCGRVSLVRQYRIAVDQFLLELPAGKREAGEEPELTARRELEEECGLVPGRLDYLGAYFATPGYCDEAIHLYWARELSQVAARPDPGEFLESCTMDFETLYSAVMSGEIQDAKTALAVLKVRALMEEDRKVRNGDRTAD